MQKRREAAFIICSPWELQEFVPITTMSDESAPAAAAPPASPAPQMGTPQPANNADDLLRQTEALAEQRREASSRAEQLEKQLAEERAARAALEKEKDVLAKSVIETAKPQFEAYKKHWEATQGREMPEDRQRAYLAVFADPALREDKGLLMKEMEQAEQQRKHAVEIAASLEEMKKEMEALKAERAKQTEILTKSSVSHGSTRTAYGAALADEGKSAQTTEVAAGDLTADEIVVPAVSDKVLPFLKAAGRTTSSIMEVVAGEFGDERQLLPVRTTVPRIPDPPLRSSMYDENGDRLLPASLRWHQPATFSAQINLTGLPHAPTSTLLQYCKPKMDPEMTFADRKAVDRLDL